MEEPCEKCGHNRWRTVRKNKVWKCRNCGHIRENSIPSPVYPNGIILNDPSTEEGIK